MFFSRLPREQKERSPKKSLSLVRLWQADVVFGEYDVIARMTTDDLGKLQDFVSDKVRTVPNVLVTSTMIISKEYRGKCYRPKSK